MGTKIRRDIAPEPIINCHKIIFGRDGAIGPELRKVIEGELWLSINFESFAELVYHKDGWETTREIIFHVLYDQPELQSTCAGLLTDADVAPHATEAMVRRRNETVGKRGAPKGNKNRAVNVADSNSNNITICSTDEKRGTSAAYTLDRLKREKPALYKEVQENKLSANQAAIKAGFRKRMITIPFDPDRLVESLKRKYNSEQWLEFLTAVKRASEVG